MVKKIIEVELEKPKYQQSSNCEPALIFSCSSCQKEFSFEKAYCKVGQGKIIKNRRTEDVFALSLYCQECAKKISYKSP
jgi:hypothetical protein